MAAAFAEGLGLDRVGLDDNYFTLGGTSLTATSVIARIAESSARAVPVQWIFTHPTPEALAHMIATAPEDSRAEDAADPSLDVLLPLRTTGTGNPVFCIHPAIGLAWCFTGLVQYLGDRPVYGLQSPALTDPDLQVDSLEDLAARYSSGSARCSRTARITWSATRSVVRSPMRWRCSSRRAATRWPPSRRPTHT